VRSKRYKTMVLVTILSAVIGTVMSMPNAVNAAEYDLTKYRDVGRNYNAWISGGVPSQSLEYSMIVMSVSAVHQANEKFRERIRVYSRETILVDRWKHRYNRHNDIILAWSWRVDMRFMRYEGNNNATPSFSEVYPHATPGADVSILFDILDYKLPGFSLLGSLVNPVILPNPSVQVWSGGHLDYTVRVTKTFFSPSQIELPSNISYTNADIQPNTTIGNQAQGRQVGVSARFEWNVPSDTFSNGLPYVVWPQAVLWYDLYDSMDDKVYSLVTGVVQMPHDINPVTK